MKKKKIFNKLKKMLIAIVCSFTLIFSMPVKSEATIVQEFLDVLLRIPDGIMWLLNIGVAGIPEATKSELKLNLKGVGSETVGRVYNFELTPYDVFTSGLEYELKDKDGNVIDKREKLPLLDINFFEKDFTMAKSKNSANILRPVVSNIYKSLRNLVLIMMMVVLIYIGIRIVVSTAVTDQAKYKQWLVDWVVGICLLLIMQYIMSFLMNVNQTVLEMLGDSKGIEYYISLSELGSGAGYSNWGDVKNDYNASTGVKYFYDKHLDISAGSASNVNSSGRYAFDDSDNTITLSNRKDWGDNGKVFINARIFKKEDESDAVVYRGNIVEYVRSLTSFGGKYVKTYANTGAFVTFNDPDASGDSNNSGDDDDDDDDEKSGFQFYGFALLYILLVAETCIFTYNYLKRVLKLAFYTMIAPLISFMYPIDKLGDGKAQAFNTWFKEYLFNVLIQPLHLLLYVVFVYAGEELAKESIVYSLVAYAYMIAAEKFFKQIFGFGNAKAGGPGALASPLAGGLAMRGLDKMSGIKPPHGPGGGKSDGKDSKKKSKINFATSHDPASSGVLPSGGGTPTPLGGGKTPGSGGRLSKIKDAVVGQAKGVGNTLSKKSANWVSGGRTGSWDRIRNNKSMVIKGAAGHIGKATKYMGKKAIKTAGGLAGAAVGLGAGVIAGAMASALTGEDKMGDAMMKGAFAGGSVASAWTERGLNTAGEGLKGLHQSAKEWRASEEGGNDVDLATKMKQESLYSENPDFFDNMSNDEYNQFSDMLKDTNKISSDNMESVYENMKNGYSKEDIISKLDAKDYNLKSKSGTDQYKADQMSKVNISKATDAEKSEAQKLAQERHNEKVEAYKKKVHEARARHAKELADAKAAGADTTELKKEQAEEKAKLMNEKAKLQAQKGKASQKDYEDSLKEVMVENKYKKIKNMK